MQNNFEAYFNPTHNVVRILGVVFEKIKSFSNFTDSLSNFIKNFVILENISVKFHKSYIKFYESIQFVSKFPHANQIKSNAIQSSP